MIHFWEWFFSWFPSLSIRSILYPVLLPRLWHRGMASSFRFSCPLIFAVFDQRKIRLRKERSSSISFVAASQWGYGFMLAFSCTQGQHSGCVNLPSACPTPLTLFCPLIRSSSDVCFPLLVPGALPSFINTTVPLLLLTTPQIEGLQWIPVS